MKFSIVLPVFNEADNIAAVYQEITRVLQAAQCNAYELIFIDDGSVDASWQNICALAQKDERVRGIKFSRNFGHQAALTAGYDAARGDAIISMDADLQDPPTLIIPMLEQWQAGADIVYARRKMRHDSWLKRTTAYMFYTLLDHVADVRIPRNVGDFRLIDKKVLRELKTCKERFRYLRGMVAWMGFTCAFVDFDRPDRHAGKTGYTWKKMFQLAFDGLTGFSLFPLRLAAYMGVFVIISGVAMFTYITIDAFIFRAHYPLFKWLVTVIYIFMGVQFLLVWILGEYIGRIYDQQKGRPLYIVDETTKNNQ